MYKSFNQLCYVFNVFTLKTSKGESEMEWYNLTSIQETTPTLTIFDKCVCISWIPWYQVPANAWYLLHVVIK